MIRYNSSMDRMFARDLPESVIKRLSIEAKRTGAINFGQGIPPFPTAPHIIAAAKAALDEPDIGVYPNFLGSVELRQAIAQTLSAGHQVSLDPLKNILVTVGAMEATAVAILSIVENGDRVGVITPDYCNHFPEVQLARGVAREISMIEKNQWELDFEKIAREAAVGMQLLILTNPNNPTGAVVSREKLRYLIKLAKKHKFWLLADETYSFLTYGKEFVSMLDFWNEHDRLIVVRSFSKEYAMTGWRVGYMIAREQALSIFAKTHDALVGCVTRISQKAAQAAITGPQTIVGWYRAQYGRLREIALKKLADAIDVSFAKPEGAYYVFVKYTQKEPSVVLADRVLAEAKVAVVPGSIFGKAGEGHLRISFAMEENTLSEGLQRLVKFFQNQKV